MRDPYEVLGVSKGANEADIKSAYRRMAKKLHPDANKHDPKAASRFAELNAAYEIVGDGDKRKAFDRGEIDAEASRASRASKVTARSLVAVVFSRAAVGSLKASASGPMASAVQVGAARVAPALRIFCAGCSAV